jgi:tetratricopeptide (TPR) repeat protein
MKQRWLMAALVALAGMGAAGQPSFETREEAYRANNQGVASLEQFHNEEAVKAFQRALSLDPELALARVNLAIAFFNLPDLPAAEREARAAAQALPQAPQPQYILGLVARGQSRLDEAKAAFQKVLAVDPEDVGALVNLGQLAMQERRFADAATAFRTASEAEPYNATAVYNLGLALIRSGQTEEGQKAMARFQELRQGGYGTLIGQTYPEQGRYAEAVASTGAEPDRVDEAVPEVQFVDASERLLPQEAAAAVEGPPPPPLLFDLDGDGDLDLYVASAHAQRLYRNEGGGRFTDATRALGLDPAAGGCCAVAADADGDGRPDLFVLRGGGGTLHHNGEKGFTDVTAASGITAGAGRIVSAAFADVDHDGDVDLLLASAGDAGRPGQLRLLKNSGTATFTDATAAAGLASSGTSVSLVPTDYDNRRDLDLLQVVSGGAPRLFRNMRDGSFRDVAAEVKLATSAEFRCAAAADLNKDGFTDFFLGVANGPDLLALSDGHGRFTVAPAPLGSSGSTAALFLDYDNDGLLDLVTVSPKGLRVLRNLGTHWADVTAKAAPDAVKAAGAALAAGDIDGDGDTDLVLRLPSGALRIWLNQGGNRNHSLAVRLAGRVSNRSGVGSKIEVRAGSLRQKIESSAATPPVAPADIVFGLGRREQADAVRVLWPAGILQTEILTKTAAVLPVEELDRKPSSCPYLYAWNGGRFEFITDFMGGGEMGNWEGPGRFDHPDPDEYVRLTDAQLQPRDGRYELRVTNELEEVLFVDRLALLAVGHPPDVEVYPNEGLLESPRPFKLYAVGDLHPPVAALDDQGRDVRERLLETDRRFVEGFPLHRIRGYAAPHALTLDLGRDDDVLLLTGWTDYAFSSDNVAAHQIGLEMQFPQLQVEDVAGGWTTVADVGLPVGRPQTVLVDLAGLWRGPSRRVRIVTNLRIYWDRARSGRSRRDLHLEAASLPATRMDLRERGFSAPTSPDGREPLGYDYTRVSWHAPWKLVPGRYTRPGDVRELLASSDDIFVLSRPGDEIALSFDAGGAPPLPPGWRRTFLFYGDGFSKEMDINSATPDSIGPLPFHGMSRYPYTAPEAFPMTAEREAAFARYNTRVVHLDAPPIEAEE